MNLFCFPRLHRRRHRNIRGRLDHANANSPMTSSSRKSEGSRKCKPKVTTPSKTANGSRNSTLDTLETSSSNHIHCQTPSIPIITNADSTIHVRASTPTLDKEVETVQCASYPKVFAHFDIHATNAHVEHERLKCVPSQVRADPEAPMIPAEMPPLPSSTQQKPSCLHCEEDMRGSARYVASHETDNWRWLRALLQNTDVKSHNSKRKLPVENERLDCRLTTDETKDMLVDTCPSYSCSRQPGTYAEFSESMSNFEHDATPPKKNAYRYFSETPTNPKPTYAAVVNYSKGDALRSTAEVDAMMDELLDANLDVSYSCQSATDSELSEIWTYKPAVESAECTNNLDTSNVGVPITAERAFFYCVKPPVSQKKPTQNLKQNLKILRKIASDETEWFEKSMSEVDNIIAGYLEEPEMSMSHSYQYDMSDSASECELKCFLCGNVFGKHSFCKAQQGKGERRCCDACLNTLRDLKNQCKSNSREESDSE